VNITSSLKSDAKWLGFKIDGDNIRKGSDGGPIAGARASVDLSGDVERRITATRIALLGPFALAAKKKKDKRVVWLLVEGQDGWQILSEVSPSDEARARKWAAAFNTAAASA